MVDLDWDDIQGNVLRGYGFDHAFHVVLSVADPEPARRLLRRLVSAVTPCTPWFSRPEHTLNVAFTHRGLAALGLDEAALAAFPEEFRDGMRARAGEYLGDLGPDAPEEWEEDGVWHPSAHVLLMVHATEPEVCDRRRGELVADALDHGFGLVSVQAAAHLEPADHVPGSWRQIEHFGFADGVSQPAVEGAQGRSRVEGNGTPLPDGTWRPVRPGEFVLGYPDEEEESPPLPAAEFSRNGTYLVYRKLAQDVAGWRRMVEERATRHGQERDLLAAKLIGRHADGAPLETPGHDLTEDDDDERAWDNDFRFADDPEGRGCPVGSHIRRANPRDAFKGLDPRLVSRHRLLRRGMPYGPPLPTGEVEDDGVDRGLLFLAYCADISRQFEFVQREWLNDGNAFGVGPTADPVSGRGTGERTMTFEAEVDAAPGPEVDDEADRSEGRRGLSLFRRKPVPVADAPDPAPESPVVVADLPRVVSVRGGEYLFQPGLSGLRLLVGAD